MTTFLINADGRLCVEVVQDGVVHRELGKHVDSVYGGWRTFFTAQQIKRLQEFGVY